MRVVDLSLTSVARIILAIVMLRMRERGPGWIAKLEESTKNVDLRNEERSKAVERVARRRKLLQSLYDVAKMEEEYYLEDIGKLYPPSQFKIPSSMLIPTLLQMGAQCAPYMTFLPSKMSQRKVCHRRQAGTSNQTRKQNPYRHHLRPCKVYTKSFPQLRAWDLRILHSRYPDTIRDYANR